MKIYGQNSQPWHNRWRFYSQQFIKTLLKKSREKHIIHSASVFRRIKNVSLLLCTRHRILLSLKVTFFFTKSLTFIFHYNKKINLKKNFLLWLYALKFLRQKQNFDTMFYIEYDFFKNFNLLIKSCFLKRKSE